MEQPIGPIQKLLKNIRFYVLLFSITLSLGIYWWVTRTYTGETLQTIRLTQFYALTALTYLYVTLLIGPAIFRFRFLPHRGQIHKARRAIGVSVFYFASLHAYLALFKQLGGFVGLTFLREKYLVAVLMAITAWIILFFMAMTSFDKVVVFLTFKRWKMIHRFVYVAALFIVIHALLLGTHFTDLSATIPQIFFFALAILLIIEAIRVDAFIQKKWAVKPIFGIVSVVVIGLLTMYFIAPLIPANSFLSFGIHNRHVTNVPAPSNSTSQEMTKRFTVSFNHQATIRAGQETKIEFRVFDANTGAPVEKFADVYGELLHLVIVNENLSFFQHVHPRQQGQSFFMPLVFPAEGTYRLYIDFQPLGAPEEQFAFTLPIEKGREIGGVGSEKNAHPTNTVDSYEVTLDSVQPLSAEKIAKGEETLQFTIRDAATKQSITTLQPYLAAFGHLVMIRESSFEFLHVHPLTTEVVTPDARSGPTVQFMPMSLYGPIPPGTYRLFLQLNPDGKLTTFNFTVEVQ